MFITIKIVYGLPLLIEVVFEVNPGNTLAHLSPETARTTQTIDMIVLLRRPIHPEWVTGFIDRDVMREILSLGYTMNLDPAASSRRRKPFVDWLVVLQSDGCCKH